VGEIMVGLIGGTGLGDALTKEVRGESVRIETPFGDPSAPIVTTRVGKLRVAVLARHGLSHQFNPSTVPYRANIWALKKLGVTHILASGATGSLREEIAPRDLVIADQVLDKTLRPGRTFFDKFAAHVELSHPFCEGLRQVLIECGKGQAFRVHPKGTYVCMEGPQFSTRAESLLHRQWGGDLIGMTVMPEAKLAREAEICYAVIGIPTDYDCWRPHAPGETPDSVMESILANVAAGTANAVTLVKAALARLADVATTDCPCQTALAKAIWTPREAIPAVAIEELRPIVGKYLK
jgi:5'-methylthioadenosine phosphorylase